MLLRHRTAPPRAVALVLATLLALSLLPPARALAQEPQEAGGQDTYSFDFTEDEVGSPPAGWSPIWMDPQATVEDDPPRLVFHGDVAGRQPLSPDVVGEVTGDVEVSALVRSPDSPQTRFGVWSRASGEVGSENGYYVDYRTDGNGDRLRLNRYSNGSFLINAATADGEVEPPVATAWYQVVIRRQGTTNMAKMWRYGADEPEDWQVSVTNSLFDSGVVGVGHPTGARVEFAHVGVGVGGQDAPRAPAGLVPEPQVPEAPDVSVSEHAHWLSVQWADAAGADWYEVERDGVLVAQDWTLSSYLDAVIAAGETGTYRVRGVSAFEGEGDWSAPVSATRPPVAFPEDLTPFEAANGSSWTTHEEEVTLLAELADASERIALGQIGETSEGRAIHLVRIGHPVAPSEEEAREQPSLLFNCGVHGNEPSPREACLRFVRDMALADDADVADLLDGRNVLVVPNQNADGRAANTRGNADGVDVNRDYIALETLEGRAVAQVLTDYRPQVVLDGHQCCGEALVPLWTRNLNMYEPLRPLARELVESEVMGGAGQVGLTNRLYVSGGDEGIMRNYGGLRHAASILLETAGGAIPGRLEEASGASAPVPSRRLRGAAAHTFALEQALDWWIEVGDDLTATIADGEAAAEANEGPVYFGGADNSPPSPGDILDPAPCGYLISNAQWGDGTVRERLEIHGIAYDEDAFGSGVLVEMAQRSRPVIALLLDGVAARSILGAQRLDDCDDPEDPEPTFAFDFTGQTPGEPPEGWNTIWRGEGNWTVEHDPARLEHRITAETDGRQVLAPDELMDIAGDIEVSAVVRVPELGPSTRLQLWLRALAGSELDSETGYYMDVQGNNLRLNRLDNGSFVSGSSHNFGGVTAGAWYEVLAARIGSTNYAKIWPYGQDEPEDWMVQSTPAALLGSGAIGFGAFSPGANVDWAHLGVGVGGEPAPRIGEGIIPEPQPPEAPVVSATARDGYVQVTWDDDEHVSSWEVQRRPAGTGEGDWVEAAGGLPSPAFADVAGLEPDSGYDWRVRGVSATERAGAWSAPVAATTPPLPEAFVTGFEERQGGSWTTYEEELAFTAAVAGATGRVAVETIGQSVQGRDIELVTIGHPAPPPVAEIAAGTSVLFACTVHGNEPAAREACLQLVRRLAFDDSPETVEFLSEHTVLVIPTVNPDGREANTRGNATGTDLNRDYMALEQPETRAVIEVLRDHDPDVVSDGHECCTSTGSRPDAELLWPTNPNNEATVAGLGQELVEERLFGFLSERGFTRRLYPGGTTENILRNHLGVKAHVGLLIETHRAPQQYRTAELGLGEHDPGVRLRRTATQLAIVDEVVGWFGDRGEAVVQARAGALAAALANEGAVTFPNGDALPETACGYVLDGVAYSDGVAATLATHGIEVVEGDGEVRVPLAQRYRTMVPLLLDARAQFNIAAGELFDCPVLVEVEVDPAEAAVVAGDTTQLSATARYDDGVGEDVTATAVWESGDETVAKVDDAGLVTGVAEGTVTITATFEGVTGSATVYVLEQPWRPGDPEVPPWAPGRPPWEPGPPPWGGSRP